MNKHSRPATRWKERWRRTDYSRSSAGSSVRPAGPYCVAAAAVRFLTDAAVLCTTGSFHLAASNLCLLVASQLLFDSTTFPQLWFNSEQQDSDNYHAKLTKK